jgi:hypothetical protein
MSSGLFRARVYLPFTYADREAARDRKGSRLAPHEWNAAAISAQTPEHREFLNRHGCYTQQIDSDGGLVLITFSGWMHEDTKQEFCQVFAGCRGSVSELSDADLEMLVS